MTQKFNSGDTRKEIENSFSLEKLFPAKIKHDFYTSSSKPFGYHRLEDNHKQRKDMTFKEVERTIKEIKDELDDIYRLDNLSRLGYLNYSCRDSDFSSNQPKHSHTEPNHNNNTKSTISQQKRPIKYKKITKNKPKQAK